MAQKNPEEEDLPLITPLGVVIGLILLSMIGFLIYAMWRVVSETPFDQLVRDYSEIIYLGVGMGSFYALGWCLTSIANWWIDNRISGDNTPIPRSWLGMAVVLAIIAYSIWTLYPDEGQRTIYKILFFAPIILHFVLNSEKVRRFLTHFELKD